MLKILLPLISATLLLACPPSKDAHIEVTGVVSQKRFPGAPNYESVAAGDREERYWFVTAPEARCFAPDGEFLDAETTLSDFQLLTGGRDFGLKEGERFKVSGTTLPATSGHHHSKVMIVVHAVEEGSAATLVK